MDFLCSCQGLAHSSTHRLSLISEMPGSKIYVCDACGAGWELDDSGKWDQMILPSDAGVEGDTTVFDVGLSNKASTPKDIIDEGYSSFFINEGVLKNPYPKSSQNYNDFERGWIQAQKKNWNLYPENKKPPLSDRYGSIGKRARSIPESSYNSYAAAKGKE